ncbi:hypothetical protein [Rhizobium sp. G21]|uniref:hypothetical protein n=1 Tax=Rhizobium sp. G21 TaxID=2758439 RepID=UPI00160304BB|nr:hypothetical protein [Rhizobium sp. G21]MBB1247697.1 hypothetical protein [Rhizobium sp. G21]
MNETKTENTAKGAAGAGRMSECHEMIRPEPAPENTREKRCFAPKRELGSQEGFGWRQSPRGAEKAPGTRQADTTGVIAERVKCIISNLPLIIEEATIGHVGATANPMRSIYPYRPPSATKRQQARIGRHHA